MQLYRFILLLSLALLSCKSEEMPTPTSGEPDNALEHPFLIVTEDLYPMHRERASVEPWKSMAEDAILRSDQGFKRNSSNSTNAYNLQKYVGAAALAYIVDDGRSKVHAQRVHDAMVSHYARLEFSDGGPWSGVVPNMGSLFVAILALDIVYNDLDPKQLQACEQVIEEQISKISRSGSWVDVRHGTYGAWDIYRGIRTTPDDDYYDGIMQQVTPDGASPVTIHYAWERVGGGDSRVSKSGYMDVLEFTKIDQRYYENERMKKFFRWLFGSSVNASKEMAIIGDMLPTQSLHNDMLHRRVVNFDEKAAEYVAWFHQGTPAIGNILTYLIPKAPLPTMSVPSSAIYPNGGAFFREPIDDPSSMHLVLHNITSQDEWHTHQETNGLALSAYGNRMLVNGGRLGAPTRPAALNNTLTLAGKNHSSRLGGGITDGFTCDGLDFARGEAGRALAGTKHERGVLLVHARDDAQAYAIVFDDVNGNDELVHTYLHPANQSEVTGSLVDGLFTATIDHYPTVSGTNLSMYYASLPEEVMIEKAPSAVPERYPDYPDHNRLEAIYQPDTGGNVSTATILYPHDASHPAANFVRTGSDFHTVHEIVHPSSTHVLLQSHGEDSIRYNNVVSIADYLLLGATPEGPDFVFVKNGIYYLQVGLEWIADHPINMFYDKGKGAISVDQETHIVLAQSVDNLIQFDDPVTIEEQDSGGISFTLSKGVYYFQ